MYQIRFSLSIKRMAKNEIWTWTKSQDPEYEDSYILERIQWLIITILKLYLVLIMFQAQY